MTHVSRRPAIGIWAPAMRIALAMIALGSPLDGGAGRVEPIADSPWGAVDLAIPGHERGDWRTRTQLVWDPVQGKLERREYALWDPFPSLRLEPFWRPLDVQADRPGPVTGQGRVEWRRRGAAAYDRSAIIAVYEGAFAGGRAEGDGSYRHRSGLTYRGEWRRGLMNGQGRLALPNGDEYVGGFRDGQHHGLGVYVDSGGNVYAGPFVAGMRDGDGAVTLSGARSYRAVFRGGAEIAGTRVAVAPPEGAGFVRVSRYPSYDDLRFGVIVDRRPGSAERDETLPLPYTSESRGEALAVFPDNRRFLDVWRGRTEIQLTQEEEAGKPETPVLGSLRFPPVPLVFELENRSPGTARVLGAFLDVEESVEDREPFIQLSVADYAECGFEPNVVSAFKLENHGWAPAENARIDLTFVDATGGKTRGSVHRDLGRIDTVAEVDLLPDLRQAGLKDDLTRDRRFPCASDDPTACTQELAATGALGQLADLVWLDGTHFYVHARGTLEYDWTDAGGTTRHKASPFTTLLLVARSWASSECGEGGVPMEVRHEPFDLQLGKRSYRIPVPLRDDVPAGVTGRWRIKLDAARSSNHVLRLVARLADGREVASRPVELLFARPAHSVPPPPED